jgi:hypothetical protein
MTFQERKEALQFFAHMFRVFLRELPRLLMEEYRRQQAESSKS